MTPKNPWVRFFAFLFLLDMLGAAAAGISFLGLRQSETNSTQIVQLNADIVRLNSALDRAAALARDAAAHAKAAAGTTAEFVAEVNYLCTVATADAKRLGVPPPSAGLCTLTAPTPAP